DAVKSKTILWPGGYAAEAVVKGQAEIVVHQISEILPVKGVTLVGPLPGDLQKITIYSAGIAQKSEQPDAARAFISYLVSEPVKAKFAQAASTTTSDDHGDRPSRGRSGRPAWSRTRRSSAPAPLR